MPDQALDPFGEADESRGELIELDRQECLELLASQPVGRVSVAEPGQAPLVVPVNYRLDGEAIVFRTGPGMKATLLRRLPVSFEVDAVDWTGRTGWSVLLRGRAYVATHWETDHLNLMPWATGDKTIWLRIVPDEITGRRLLARDLGWPSEARGYM